MRDAATAHKKLAARIQQRDTLTTQRQAQAALGVSADVAGLTAAVQLRLDAVTARQADHATERAEQETAEAEVKRLEEAHAGLDAEAKRVASQVDRLERAITADRATAEAHAGQLPVAETRPTTTPPKPNVAAPTERRPGASKGAGSGAASAGTGTRGAPTGRNPDASSAGGEGLNVSQRGAECPSAGYCENIVRQVRRWFRRPEGSTGTAEACFTILRDGTVDDIEVNRVRGGFPFRMAVTEAVEQAGLHKAFGALPSAFDAAELPVCVDITPQT